jgi:hypothetical protein
MLEKVLRHLEERHGRRSELRTTSGDVETGHDDEPLKLSMLLPMGGYRTDAAEPRDWIKGRVCSTLAATAFMAAIPALLGMVVDGGTDPWPSPDDDADVDGLVSGVS